MGHAAWKKRERQAARQTGAERRGPAVGGSDGGRPDSDHAAWWAEHKHRQRHTAVSIWRSAEAARQKARRRDSATPPRVLVTLSEARVPGVWYLFRADDWPELVAALAAVERGARGPGPRSDAAPGCTRDAPIRAEDCPHAAPAETPRTP